MLTGDKDETAKSIGQSCGIIDDRKQDIIQIDALNL